MDQKFGKTSLGGNHVKWRMFEHVKGTKKREVW